jgi:hypothetical protein
MSMIRSAWASAVKHDSWRGKLEVARFITEHTSGKAIAKTLSISSKAGDMVARLEALQLGGSDDTGDTIEP